MRELSVYVTGIAAFVEDYRRVMAVNAIQPTAVKVAGRQVTVPAHFPYVRIPRDHVAEPESSISHEWNTMAVPGLFADPRQKTFVRFLHFHEVVLPDTDPDQPSLDETPINATGLPVMEQEENGLPEDHSSVLWLAPMEKLTKASTIDPRHVVKNPGVDVAAYIRFPKGRISTAAPTPFRFVAVKEADGKTTGQLNQAVAQLMVCKMKVPDDAFEVKCRDYRNNGANDFTIQFKGGVADPWMVFACTSLEDALQLPSAGVDFGVDTHFRLVYRLVAALKEDDVVLPKSIPPAPNAKPLGGGGCVPPRLKGGSTGGVEEG
jgi:hypothetical protein